MLDVAARSICGAAARARDGAAVLCALAAHVGRRKCRFPLEVRWNSRGRPAGACRPHARYHRPVRARDKPAAELSGDEQQRVASPALWLREPRLVLLDEPLSDPDPHLRDQVRLQLKMLQERLGFKTPPSMPRADRPARSPWAGRWR